MKSAAVLIFSASDGTGGAGILADYHAVRAAGAIPLTIITAITAQNLDGVKQIWNLSPAQIREQFSVLQKAPIKAIKIGVVGTNAPIIAACIRRIDSRIPVIWDPVLSPTNGVAFSDNKIQRQMINHLLPIAHIITPNQQEIIALSGIKDPLAAARALSQKGARRILITGVGDSQTLSHILYNGDKVEWQKKYRRRPGQYHGSGCLFSSALAARIACGDTPAKAAMLAHQATTKAIKNARKIPQLGKQWLL